MSGETLESLLEFLTISGRVAVVQLEPKRARAFAEALRLAMEFGEARAAKLTAERDDWRAACMRAREVEEALTGVGPLADVAGAVAAEREACAALVGDYVDLASGNRVRTDFAKAIRARGAK